MMEEEDHTDRFGTSMRVFGERLEVMRKKNQASLLQNEIFSLERELSQLEVQQEEGATNEPSSEEKPRRHLPDLPRGRRVHFDSKEPPILNLYDESSIGVFLPH